MTGISVQLDNDVKLWWKEDNKNVETMEAINA